MKPVFEKVGLLPGNSFKAFKIDSALFDVPWHYHPELEIKYVIESSGVRYVGDSVKDFEKGDLVLIGTNLPHCWTNDEEHINNKNERAQAIVVQFLREFMGVDFFKRPELSTINELFDRSSNGIRFYGETSKNAGKMLEELEQKEGYERLSLFLDILNILSLSNEYELLSGYGFVNKVTKTEQDRLDKVFNYVKENFKHKISLDEVSQLINMSPAAFCRYFKSRTKKTFLSFVNEFKISHSARMLVETEKNVSEVCYESGFNNVSNFNRQFLKYKGETPLKFREIHKKKNYNFMTKFDYS